ncbi:MAG: YeeE/YedE family protein [Parachlamydiaceae bacterium]|nr:YeeE/YedE family protein [Parachlamydiaceae bacterium]
MPYLISAETDAPSYSDPAWSPYLVGAGIGMLSWLTFYFSDKPIGTSSFYATVAGIIGNLVVPHHTASLKYYQDHPPKLNWSVFFVSAIFFGSFIAAFTGDEITNEWLPPMWVARFGNSIALRAAFAMAGGALMGFGARLAGGCTSGHGISGTLQLNVSSWIVLICLFLSGIATAMLMY